MRLFHILWLFYDMLIQLCGWMSQIKYEMRNQESWSMSNTFKKVYNIRTIKYNRSCPHNWLSESYKTTLAHSVYQYQWHIHTTAQTSKQKTRGRANFVSRVIVSTHRPSSQRMRAHDADTDCVTHALCALRCSGVVWYALRIRLGRKYHIKNGRFFGLSHAWEIPCSSCQSFAFAPLHSIPHHFASLPCTNMNAFGFAHYEFVALSMNSLRVGFVGRRRRLDSTSTNIRIIAR